MQVPKESLTIFHTSLITFPTRAYGPGRGSNSVSTTMYPFPSFERYSSASLVISKSDAYVLEKTTVSRNEVWKTPSRAHSPITSRTQAAVIVGFGPGEVAAKSRDRNLAPE